MKNLFLLSSFLLLSLTNLANSNPLLIKDNKELVFENKTNENNNLKCLKVNNWCYENYDCCSGICYVYGSHAECIECIKKTDHTMCEYDYQCCSGLFCYNGESTGNQNRCVSCFPIGSYCKENSNCCSRFCYSGASTGNENRCVENCFPVNSYCKWDGECCSGLFCYSGDSTGNQNRCLKCFKDYSWCKEDSNCCSGICYTNALDYSLNYCKPN